MPRLKASDPDYPAIALALRDLGIAINPEYWFAVDFEAPDRERIAAFDAIDSRLGVLDNLLVDFTFKELTHGLE